MNTIRYHGGYDHFMSDPGEYPLKHCEACGILCDVERNRVDQRTMWARKTSTFDVFTCPNAGLDWHTEVIKILQAMKDMPSQRIVEIMKKDVDDILRVNITDTYALLWMEVSDAH